MSSLVRIIESGMEGRTTEWYGASRFFILTSYLVYSKLLTSPSFFLLHYTYVSHPKN